MAVDGQNVITWDAWNTVIDVKLTISTGLFTYSHRHHFFPQNLEVLTRKSRFVTFWDLPI